MNFKNLIRVSALLAILAGSPAYAFYTNPVLFGGDGHNGPVTKSGTETTPVFIDASKFTVSSTWTPKSGTRVNCTGPVIISGTLNVATDAKAQSTNYGTMTGATPGTMKNSAGPGAGSDGAWNTFGPSGGGFGGRGGDGFEANSGFHWCSGGPTYSFQLCPAGSAGGNGSRTNLAVTSVPGVGGGGGGGFSVYSAGAINISGTVNLNGGSGTNATGTPATSNSCSGGAGGSGGFGLFASKQSITVTGNVTANGGAGGNGFYQGAGAAGGGGGVLLFVAPAISLGGVVVANGGAPGTADATLGNISGGANSTGQAGLIITITETPNLPLLSKIMNEPGYLAPNLRKLFGDRREISLSQAQLVYLSGARSI